MTKYLSLDKRYYRFFKKVLSFYQKRRYVLLKTEVRLKQVDKNYLEACLWYFSNVSPSTLLSCGWWRFVWRRRERGFGRRRLRSNKVIELREEPQKREQKKRASKISLRSSLILKKAATYSPALHCSTIGADGLNFSVRNGKRWNPDAITT